MTTTSIVKLSELEGARRRIDAEYYQPEYLEVHDKLKRKGVTPLKYFCDFIKKGIFDLSPLFYVESGVPFIRTTEIKSEIADLSSVVYIPENTHIKHNKTELGAGDIVFTKIGANIGDSAILPRKYRKYNFSQNVAGAKIRSNRILPYYLAAYLSSKYGRFQLKRVQMLSGQGKLELTDIKKISIFVASPKLQAHIGKLYLRAEDKIQESIELYSQAENLLLEELGLKDFKPKYELSYTANLSKAFGVHRVDAEYFQPVYDKLIDCLETKFDAEKLKYLVSKREIKIDPISHQLYKYIEISDIRTDIGEITYTERFGSELPPNARIPISGGELLVSKVRPTRKAIAIVPDNLKNNAICSSAFTVLNATSPLREYIFISLRSITGLLQLEQPTTGTEYPTLRDEDVENIRIPILLPETQQKIAFLVQQSHEARNKAKELLEEAKREVEEAIENEIKK